MMEEEEEINHPDSQSIVLCPEISAANLSLG
jgi:hypothetical protein